MGMFDYIKCDYKLKDSPPIQFFQTKSFEEPNLDMYEITREGVLMLENKKVDFTGSVDFYEFTDRGRWYEYSAKFENGNLISLNPVFLHANPKTL